jgi:hypothetical protein
MQSVSAVLVHALSVVYIRRAAAVIHPLQGLQVWNPNMKHTHTDPASLPRSIGSNFWVQADLNRNSEIQNL